MPAYTISLPIANAAALVSSYDQVAMYRAMGANQPFLELTNPATRLALSATQAQYTFSDPNGQPAYLYAAGLINSVTGAVGPMGEATSGDGDAALGLISPDDIKSRYLFGLPLTDRKSNPLPDSTFAFYIKSAVSALERDLDIAIAPKVVVGETLHYHRQPSERLPITIYTQWAPVQSVQSLLLQFPYASTASPVPPEWLTVAGDYGSIYLYPQSSLLALVSNIPGLTYSYGWFDDFIPNAWVVSYTAGFPPGKVPPDLLDAIGMMAAIGPLELLGSLVLPPGIASTSLGIDGLSQSLSGQGGYADRINQYLTALEAAKAALRRRYRGTMLRGD